MSSTAIVVTIMAVMMVAMGAFIARISPRERGTGIAIAALGIILLLAYIAADPGAPDTPTATPPRATPQDTTP